jgi:phage tail-like protein
MTESFDLWDWMEAMVSKPSLRADAEVVLYAADGVTERVRFILSRCIPVKLKAPALNAKDGTVAIEEFQMAYESLSVKRPSGLPTLPAPFR